ncbi:MAG: fibronectin type III domain-containing protein, partial [Patescibacteria group bacterium]
MNKKSILVALFAAAFAFALVVNINAQTPPTAPSNLRLEPPAVAGTIYLRWNDNSDNEDKFNIERKLTTENTYISLVQLSGSNITNYADASVTNGVNYDYRVQACLSGTGCSDYAHLTFVSAPSSGGGAPVAPGSLTAIVSGSNVNLSWSDVSTDENEFKIFDRLLGSVTWNHIGSVGTDITTYTHSNPPSGTHEYTVAACNTSGCSSSNITSATVSGGGGDTVAPSAISDLTTSAPMSNSITLNWTAPGDDGTSGTATSYMVKYANAYITDGTWGSATPWSGTPPMPAAAGTSQSVTVTGLNPSTTYWFAVKTHDEAGNYSISNSPSGTTAASSGGGDTMPPSIPVNVSASSPTTSSITVSWSASSDNSSGVAGYKIYRNGMYLTSVTVLSYADTGLSSGTTYSYTVAAYDVANNVSAQSPSVSATVLTSGGTGGGGNIPNPPSGLTASASGSSVYLAWTDNSSNETDFKIHKRLSGSATWNWTGSSAGSNVTSWTIAGEPNGTYEYHVTACNTYGCSGMSNIATITISGAVSGNVLPDLTILDIYLGPNIAVPSYTGNDALSIKLSNVGNAGAAETGHLYIWIDGVLKWTYSFSTLADKSFLVPGGITIAQPQYLSGEHTVKVVIDPNNAIAESYENNNTLEKMLGLAPTAETPTGVCTIRDSFTASPIFSAPDSGRGYAKMKKSGVNTLAGLQSACVREDFDNLLRSYCASNAGPVQQQVVTYNSDGSVQSNSCGAFGCQSVYCPTTAYPIETQILPFVNGWGLSIGADGNSTIGFAFNTSVDPASLSSENLRVSRADTGEKVMSTVMPYATNANLTLKLVSGVKYVSTARNIRTVSGAQMAGEYQCAFIALASGYYTSCPTMAGTAAATTLTTAKNGILRGTVVDASGKTIARVGFHLFRADFSGNFGGSTGDDGTFSVDLPAGTYNLEVFTPLDRPDLMKPALLKLSIESGVTRNITIKFDSATVAGKIIAGKVQFSDGRPITDARVGAYSENTGQWLDVLTDA